MQKSKDYEVWWTESNSTSAQKYSPYTLTAAKAAARRLAKAGAKGESRATVYRISDGGQGLPLYTARH